MAASDLLTVAEAADALNLSPQRVHQLLDSGHLDGPDLPPGRLRFPAGAGRVTSTSVDDLLRARSGDTAARQNRRRELRPTPAAPGDVQADQARAAAQELKVKMDALRDQVRAERVRNRQLMAVASNLLDLLKEASDDADELDGITDGYSHALTQLLSPDAPPRDGQPRSGGYESK